MIKTPHSMRLCIALLGRRNVGKSSLLNALTRQDLAIVSDVPGTTTDPIEKAMELPGVGPILWIDTAGVDDHGTLGEQRIEKTQHVIKRCDVALVVYTHAIGDVEEALMAQLEQQKTPYVLVHNQTISNEQNHYLGHPIIPCDARAKWNISAVLESLLTSVPESFWTQKAIIRDLVPPQSCIVLVTPIDKEAPRGRLILPQVQTIRDILDGDHYCMVTSVDNLPRVLSHLKSPPALVVTDSQAFKAVDALTPPEIALTSFSILFARLKGDLNTFLDGAKQIETLRPHDAVLIAEACTHHAIDDDIGTVKIPKLLEQKIGGPLHITHVQGCQFPSDLTPYKLVIHCGACTFTPKQMAVRLEQCRRQNVPITNYGLCISAVLAILNRATAPFKNMT